MSQSWTVAIREASEQAEILSRLREQVATASRALSSVFNHAISGMPLTPAWRRNEAFERTHRVSAPCLAVKLASGEYLHIFRRQPPVFVRTEKAGLDVAFVVIDDELDVLKLLGDDAISVIEAALQATPPVVGGQFAPPANPLSGIALSESNMISEQRQVCRFCQSASPTKRSRAFERNGLASHIRDVHPGMTDVPAGLTGEPQPSKKGKETPKIAVVPLIGSAGGSGKATSAPSHAIGPASGQSAMPGQPCPHCQDKSPKKSGRMFDKNGLVAHIRDIHVQVNVKPARSTGRSQGHDGVKSILGGSFPAQEQWAQEQASQRADRLDVRPPIVVRDICGQFSEGEDAEVLNHDDE